MTPPTPAEALYEAVASIPDGDLEPGIVGLRWEQAVLAALAASGWQLVKDEPSAVGVTRRAAVAWCESCGFAHEAGWTDCIDARRDEGLRAALARLVEATTGLILTTERANEYVAAREQARAALASGEDGQ